jgi:hypothetical protein
MTSTVALALIGSELMVGTTSQGGVRRSKGQAKGLAREDYLSGRDLPQPKSGLLQAPALPFSVVRRSAWKVRFCEANTIRIDSLILFSESPAILHLFGARRLSQQYYPSFPEP